MKQLIMAIAAIPFVLVAGMSVAADTPKPEAAPTAASQSVDKDTQQPTQSKTTNSAKKGDVYSALGKYDLNHPNLNQQKPLHDKKAQAEIDKRDKQKAEQGSKIPEIRFGKAK